MLYFFICRHRVERSIFNNQIYGLNILRENSTKLAIKEAQAAFEGLAVELGLNSEDDVVNLVKEVRKELWEKKD